MSRKFVLLSSSLAVLNALNAIFMPPATAADLRSRNAIVIKNSSTNLVQSANGTDVVNIAKPNQNGVSHNIYTQFDINGNVIFNNSTETGKSQIGSTVQANPNFNGTTAQTIISEITSGKASSMSGALEVFGSRADLIFANENGLMLNGMRFINAAGVTLTTGAVRDRIVDVSSSAPVSIGENGVVLDGDYFNIISRSMDIAGAISSSREGVFLEKTNLIAGLNTVDLSDAINPRISESRNSNDAQPKLAIDGHALGSMYSQSIAFISTESGVGVRHAGITTALENIEFMLDGVLENSGTIQSSENIDVDVLKLVNNGQIHGSENVSVSIDKTMQNAGSITAGDTLAFDYRNTDQAVDLDLGKAYGESVLSVSVKNTANIRKKLENSGSIEINSDKDLMIYDTVAAGKDLELTAQKVENNGYLYAAGDLTVDAKSILSNNGTVESGARMELNAPELTNKAYIFSEGDLFIESDNLSNLAQLDGYVVQDESLTIYASGWADYGDTAFKRWQMHTNLSHVNTWLNLLTLKQASLQSRGNIYINSKSKNRNASITNQGKIVAGKDLASWGNVSNVTPNKSVSVVDLIKQIKLENGVQGKEFLGSWNTHSSQYFSGGTNLYDVLVYFAGTNEKDHQREGTWNAIKNAAEQNALIKQYLSLLFGADYAGLRFIPPVSEWNMSAKVVYLPKESATIAAKGSANFESNTFNQGLVGSLDKNFAMVESTLADAVIDPDWIAQQIDAILNSGFFDIVINEDIDSDGDGIHFEFETQPKPGDDQASHDDNYGFSYLLDQLKRQEMQSGLEQAVRGNTKNEEIVFRVIGNEQLEYIFLSQLYSEMDTVGMLTSDDIKVMLDNAVAASSELGLEIGKALTQEQIASLTGDLVWYVESDVQGRNVLVPVIYQAGNKSGAHTGSTLVAGSVSINTGELNSSHGTISAVDKLEVKSKDAELRDTELSGKTVDVAADTIKIGANNVVNDSGELVAAGSTVNAEDKVKLSAQDKLIVEGSDIAAGDSVSLSGSSVTIAATQQQASSYTQQVEGGLIATTTDTHDTLRGSQISAENISVQAQEDLNITASILTAKGSTGSIELRGETVNISSGVENHKQSASESFSGVNGAGLAQHSTSNTTSTTSASVGSEIHSDGSLEIVAAGDVTLKGSTLTSGADMTLTGDNINIVDAVDTSESHTEYWNYQVVGGKVGNRHENSSESVGSKIHAGGNLDIASQDTVRVVGGVITSAKDTVIQAQNTVFEAGKNTHESSESSVGLGFYANASFELAGHRFTASASGINNSSTVGSYVDQNVTSDGRRNNFLGYTEAGFEISYNKQNSSSVVFNNAVLSADNITILNKDRLDIGGVDMIAAGNVNAQASEIVSTAYEDHSSSKSESFGIYARERVEFMSPVVDAVNSLMEAVHLNEQGYALNPGIVSTQLATNALNLAVTDAFTAKHMHTVGMKGSFNTESITAQKGSSVNAQGNVVFKSTQGDIVFNGVTVRGDNVVLDSAKDVQLNAAEASNRSDGGDFGLNVSFTHTASTDMIDGGALKTGVSLFADGTFRTEQSNTNTNARIEGNNVVVRSEGNTKLHGANVVAENVTVNVGKDLVIDSVVDQSSHAINGFILSTDVNLGVSTNRVVVAGGSVGVGVRHEESNATSVNQQSGISASKTISGNVGGNVALNAGVVDAAQGGNLNVAGNVTAESIKTKQTQDGAIVTTSVGFDGLPAGSAVVDISNHIDRGETVNSAANVTINGSADHGINRDTTETVTGAYDNSWAGGSINIGPTITKGKEFLKKHPGSSGAASGSASQNEVTSFDTRL